jgi:tetratricopeptide (TPR) repeat protein
MDGRIDVETGRKYASLVLEAVAHGKSNCKGKLCEAWDIIEEYAPVRLEGLESIDGFYDCNYYKDKYFTLFKQYPDSCEIVNLAYARMLRGNCPAGDPGLQEVKAVKSSTCYVAPPAVSCAAQGNENYSQGKYSAAVESYLECVENTSDVEQKAKYLLLVAKIYYRDLRNYSKSRKYALDAARIKPGWGEPYMLIGNLYASSGPLCGTGRGWESQVVTWPAIDMWTKAKSVDAQVAGEANALISRYKQYMPKKEDIFFRNIKSGDAYFVPCWIQESTTVRTAD